METNWVNNTVLYSILIRLFGCFKNSVLTLCTDVIYQCSKLYRYLYCTVLIVLHYTNLVSVMNKWNGNMYWITISAVWVVGEKNGCLWGSRHNTLYWRSCIIKGLSEALIVSCLHISINIQHFLEFIYILVAIMSFSFNLFPISTVLCGKLFFNVL